MTNNSDVDYKILKQLDPYDIYDVCLSNQYLYQLCLKDPYLHKAFQLRKNYEQDMEYMALHYPYMDTRILTRHKNVLYNKLLIQLDILQFNYS